MMSPTIDDVNKVTVLAAPEEEIIKYTQSFDDVKLKPVAVDVQSFMFICYFKTEEQLHPDKVYLILELNLTSTNISIFHQHKVEFLRYQPLSVSANEWQPNAEQPIQWNFTGDKTRLFGEMEDHLNEIERLMNFYRFSLHQGEKAVTDMIVLGDFPEINKIVARIKQRYDLPSYYVN